MTALLSLALQCASPWPKDANLRCPGYHPHSGGTVALQGASLTVLFLATPVRTATSLRSSAAACIRVANGSCSPLLYQTSHGCERRQGNLTSHSQEGASRTSGSLCLHLTISLSLSVSFCCCLFSWLLFSLMSLFFSLLSMLMPPASLCFLAVSVPSLLVLSLYLVFFPLDRSLPDYFSASVFSPPSHYKLPLSLSPSLCFFSPHLSGYFLSFLPPALSLPTSFSINLLSLLPH
ncbi:hypothetical protein FKM82_029166 [Ascaphus truei]